MIWIGPLVGAFLFSRGAGEREIAEATDRMTCLNAAWDLISSQNS